MYKKERELYSVEMDVDRPVCFDRCGVAAQRYNFAEDPHSLIREGFEILCVDARGSFGGHQ